MILFLFSYRKIKIYYNKYVGLTEISVEKFNNLAYAEPDGNVFQNSCWADHEVKNGYRPVFFEYLNDCGTTMALAMFLLKKNSVFNKFTAYCPNGYLINWYDDELLRAFNEELVASLKKYRVNRIVIEPHVAVEKAGRHVSEVLESIGYQKTKEIFTYEIDVNGFERNLSDSNIILKVKRTEGDIFEYRDFFKNNRNSEYLELYNSLKPYTAFYTVSLDSYKSKRAANENIQECKIYIDEHKDDYKFEQKIADKEQEIKRINQIVAGIERYEKSHGTDPLIYGMGVTEYSGKIGRLFSISLDPQNFFNAEAELINKIVEDAHEKGCIIVDGSQEFSNARKTELIGEYTLNF